MKNLLLAPLVLATLIFSIPSYASGHAAYVKINGLVCDFCARALEKVFDKQDAVNAINVDLDTKLVTIEFKDGQNLPDETITALINDAGYNVDEIKHEQ